MDLCCNADLARGYKSATQQVRKITESWISANGYCLNCESNNLIPTRANTMSRDFTCCECSHPYELKSKRGAFSTKVLDGAYRAMIKTIREGKTPTFLLLEYSASWDINGLTAIHHSLITETSIEARKPLAPSARRAGWIGCNIVLSAIAIEGRIPIIRNGVIEQKALARGAFGRLERLAVLSSSDRSWAGTVLNLLHRLPKRSFALSEAYEFEPYLQELYPRNNNIRPKIRQQLQVLRDAGLINFLDKGKYELTSAQ